MKRHLVGGLLLAAAIGLGAAPAARAADINVCLWGTINGPDALINGMTYGFRDYLEYLNQTAGGIAGQPVHTTMLDGRYKLDEFHERIAHIPTLRQARIEDAGHMLHHDQPERLAALLEDFLG